MHDDDIPTFAALAAAASGGGDAALSFLTPRTIAETQAAANAELVAGFERLPATLAGRDGESSQAFLEAHGFRVLGRHDNMYLKVSPPPGWSLRPAWTDTVLEALDADGNVRFQVLHKVAAYDPRADITPLARYQTRLERLGPDGEPTVENRHPACAAMRWAVVDAVGGRVVHRTGTVETIDYRAASDAVRVAYHARADAIQDEARDWLDANRPAWRDPAASWA